jgi:hypothetical protein
MFRRQFKSHLFSNAPYSIYKLFFPFRRHCKSILDLHLTRYSSQNNFAWEGKFIGFIFNWMLTNQISPYIYIDLSLPDIINKMLVV